MLCVRGVNGYTLGGSGRGAAEQRRRHGVVGRRAALRAGEHGGRSGRERCAAGADRRAARHGASREPRSRREAIRRESCCARRSPIRPRLADSRLRWQFISPAGRVTKVDSAPVDVPAHGEKLVELPYVLDERARAGIPRESRRRQRRRRSRRGSRLDRGRFQSVDAADRPPPRRPLSPPRAARAGAPEPRAVARHAVEGARGAARSRAARERRDRAVARSSGDSHGDRGTARAHSGGPPRRFHESAARRRRRVEAAPRAVRRAGAALEGARDRSRRGRQGDRVGRISAVLSTSPRPAAARGRGDPGEEEPALRQSEAVDAVGRDVRLRSPRIPDLPIPARMRTATSTTSPSGPCTTASTTSPTTGATTTSIPSVRFLRACPTQRGEMRSSCGGRTTGSTSRRTSSLRRDGAFSWDDLVAKAGGAERVDESLRFAKDSPMVVSTSPGLEESFGRFHAATPEQLGTLAALVRSLRDKTAKPVMVGDGGAWNRFEFAKVPFFDIFDPETEPEFPANLHTDLWPLVAGADRVIWLRPQMYESVPYERWRFHTFVELMRGARGWQIAHGPSDATMFRGLHGELAALEPAVYSQDAGPAVEVDPPIEHWSRRASGKTYVIAATTHAVPFGRWRWTDEASSAAGRARMSDSSIPFGRSENPVDAIVEQIQPGWVVHGIDSFPAARAWPSGTKLRQWVKIDRGQPRQSRRARRAERQPLELRSRRGATAGSRCCATTPRSTTGSCAGSIATPSASSATRARGSGGVSATCRRSSATQVVVPPAGEWTKLEVSLDELVGARQDLRRHRLRAARRARLLGPHLRRLSRRRRDGALGRRPRRSAGAARARAYSGRRARGGTAVRVLFEDRSRHGRGRLLRGRLPWRGSLPAIRRRRGIRRHAGCVARLRDALKAPAAPLRAHERWSRR